MPTKTATKPKHSTARAKSTAKGVKTRAKNKAQQVKGKTKKAVGKATGNKRVEAKGRADSAISGLKQAGEKVVGAVKDVLGKR